MTSVQQLADDCTGCGAVFQSNTDLTAMPRGRRVAWDRASGRTWRICTRCGDWNLMGREAGAGLATELASRLPGRTAGGVMHDLVGSVEVILIEDIESGRVGTRAGVKGRRLARWLLNPISRVVLNPLVPVVAILLITSLGNPFRPLSLLHNIGTLLVAIVGGQHFARWILRRKQGNTFVIAALALCASALVLFTPSDQPWVTPVGLAASLILLMGVMALLELFGPPFVPVTLYGKSRGLTPFAARSAELALSPDGEEIVVCSLGRRKDMVVRGKAAERALTWLNLIGHREPSLEDFEAGWLLARAHGTSAGLVRELLALQSDPNGPTLIRDLPPAWRAAFAFTCAESQGDEKERAQLLAKIRESSEVAAIAERLETEAG